MLFFLSLNGSVFHFAFSSATLKCDRFTCLRELYFFSSKYVFVCATLHHIFQATFISINWRVHWNSNSTFILKPNECYLNNSTSNTTKASYFFSFSRKRKGKIKTTLIKDTTLEREKKLSTFPLVQWKLKSKCEKCNYNYIRLYHWVVQLNRHVNKV